MATEFVLANTIRELNSSELQELLQAFNEPVPKGFHNARWGKLVNDSQFLVGLFTWDTIEDHFSFASSPRFSALESAVKPAVTDWPPRLFHVHFKQGLPSLDIPFAELILLKRQPATASLLDSETLQQSLESFVKIASSQQQGLRTHFYGTMHEDSETFVVLFVWESLESKEAAQKSTAWGEILTSTEQEIYLIAL